MKPPEILAMIEEAAGTRMYEAKKQQEEGNSSAGDTNKPLKKTVAGKIGAFLSPSLNKKMPKEEKSLSPDETCESSDIAG